jgi:hypothetical protein
MLQRGNKDRALYSYSYNIFLNQGTRYKLTYDGMHQLDIPKTRQYDHGEVKVIAKNIAGEAVAITSLEVKDKMADYRGVLKQRGKSLSPLESVLSRPPSTEPISPSPCVPRLRFVSQFVLSVVL